MSKKPVIEEYKVIQSSTEQKLSLYVIICSQSKERKLYVGQTGNKKRGCNNITTRIGKHLAYSGDDNNLRKHLREPEKWDLEVIFRHVHDYDGTNNKVPVMLALESLLIRNLAEMSQDYENLEILNSVETINKHLITDAGTSMVNEVKKRVREKLITNLSKGRS